MTTDQIRAKITAAMGRQGVSQHDLATASGVAQNRISEFLSGKREMKPEGIARLARPLGYRCEVRLIKISH